MQVGFSSYPDSVLLGSIVVQAQNFQLRLLKERPY